MMIIALFIVVMWGFISCFTEAKQAWRCSQSDVPGNLKKLYILKSLMGFTLGFMALGGLFQAIIGAGTNG